MPREPQPLIFVGIKDGVIALDARTGEEVWRTGLRRADFVTILFDGESVVAANSGEVYCLDPRSGAIVWHNELKGLGRGLATLASSRSPGQSDTAGIGVAKKLRDQQAAAAAAAAG